MRHREWPTFLYPHLLPRTSSLGRRPRLLVGILPKRGDGAMKQWGLGRWGPLLAVLTLLVSAGVFVPLTAQAQGKKVWGLVTDCANANPVGATVFLVDAHAQYADVQTTASTATGFYSFPAPPATDVPASYYKVRVQPTGF